MESQEQLSRRISALAISVIIGFTGLLVLVSEVADLKKQVVVCVCTSPSAEENQ